MFDVRPGEAAAVLWAAATYFALLASYFVMRPVREAAAVRGNPELIPWLFTATSVAMVVLAAPWGALVARLPRQVFVPLIYRAFAAQMLIFAALFQLEVAPAGVGKVFYVWLSVFNLFVVSVFWSLCADVSRPDQGRRLFGPIAAGGTAGAFVGPLLTRELVHHVGPAGLLLISVALLETAVWCARGLDRASRRLPAPEAAASADAVADRPIGGGALAGLAALRRSPYLAGIAAYALCTACLATFVYLDQAAIVKRAFTRDADRIAYFADVDLWTAVITLVIQTLLTARLLRWLGVGAVLAVLPITQAAGALALHSSPTLIVAATVSATSRGVTHALSRPSRETLFTAVAREDKYKTKNVIDTLVYRVADTGAAWLFRGLAAAGVAAAAVALPLVAAWTALSFALGIGHRRRIG